MTALPESIPDFSLDASRTTILSAQSGNWSSASTWVGGVVPIANNVVRIVSTHIVTVDDTAAVAYTVSVDGTLRFANNVNTRLKVTNLQVMAGDMGEGTRGVLEVGTAASPIASTVTAEIVIANTALGGSVADPDQFGTGLIAFGKVSMHGSVKTPTFVRVATEPHLGDTTLTLSAPVTGWMIGDRVVLPDTRHLHDDETVGGGQIVIVNQWEERTVLAISSDGLTVTLNSALTYNHLGARDLAGVLTFLPHVGNLARNVIIRSEDPLGTRGHVLFNHLADVDIRYALFKDLGRTTYLPLSTQGGLASNHIGRYPIHAHHLSGPLPTPANGYQFTLLGNAVDGGSVETRFKWGITVHGSHYGLIQDNVVYNYNGAAVATEDGSESFNLFDHNFVMRGIGEPTDTVSEARMALGTEGVGFWFHGPNNYVTNNVAANYQNLSPEASYGYVFQFRYLGDVKVPNFKGADTIMAAGQSTTMDGNSLPLLKFENNEAYGAMQGGLTFWWVSSLDPDPKPNAQESVIKDLKLWNLFDKNIYAYPSQRVTFDGLIIRGSYDAGGKCCGYGIWFGDYSSKGHIVRNSNIQGMYAGIVAPESGFGPEANLTIENTYLRNDRNLMVPTPGSVNGCWMNNKLVVTNNVTFDAPPGRSLFPITMVNDVANAGQCLTKLDQMRVFGYAGNPSDSFQVYHPDVNVLPRPRAGCVPTTKAGITGFNSSGDLVDAPTCPLSVPAIASITPSAVTVTAGANVSFSTNVTGEPAPTVQWQVSTNGTTFVDLANTAPHSGVTTTTLTIAAASFGLNANKYRALATNDAGSTSSTAVTLTVNTVPAITSITSVPETPTVTAGANVSFTLNNVTGSPAPTVKWQFSTDGTTFVDLANTAPYSGVTTTTLTITAASFSLNANKYRGLATNDAGSTSSAAPTLTVNIAPAITGDPSGQTVTAGQNAAFTVAASGNPAPTSYQWQVSTNGGGSYADISGATAATLTLTAVPFSSNGNKYRATATNSIGSSPASAAATLTVNTAPVITAQPANQTVTAGQTTTFTVAASGNPAPTYQWQGSIDGGASFSNLTETAPYSGATTTTLTVTAAPFTLNGVKYRAIATNSVASATTGAVTFTVNTLPVITTNPADQTVTAGQSATFTVGGTGNPTPTYQWQMSTNGTTWTDVTNPSAYGEVPTATITATLTVTGTPFSLNGARYRGVAINAAGSSTSAAATLTVNTVPSITSQPANQTVTAGQGTTFTAAGTGSPTPTYQWQGSTDGGASFSNLTETAPYSGVTTGTLTLMGAQFDLTGALYRAVVTNAAGSTPTNAARLTVNAAPSITGHPSNQTVVPGEDPLFTVAAIGTPTLLYRWQVSTNGGSSFSNLTDTAPQSGTTTPTLKLTAVLVTRTGEQYRVVVTNSLGTATSNAATLTVTQSETLSVGYTVIRAAHIVELRARIEALRVRFGLGPFDWLDPTLEAGSVTIKAQHLIDLRTALSEVYTAAHLPAPVYSEEIAPGVILKASHLAEMRAAVAAIE